MAAPRSSIQREIRQRRPFPSRAQEALVSLLRTSDGVRRKLGQMLEPHGVTLQQYNVLRILRGSGDEGVPTLDIADRMIEQTPGITRLLDRLEAKGLVTRERCPQDRRQVLCRITPVGLRLLEKLDAPVDAADRAIFARLRAAEVTTLLALLAEVRTSLGSEAE